jgi:hypothetical protein
VASLVCVALVTQIEYGSKRERMIEREGERERGEKSNFFE